MTTTPSADPSPAAGPVTAPTARPGAADGVSAHRGAAHPGAAGPGVAHPGVARSGIAHSKAKLPTGIKLAIDFGPLLVTMDSHGGSLYRSVQADTAARRAQVLASLGVQA